MCYREYSEIADKRSGYLKTYEVLWNFHFHWFFGKTKDRGNLAHTIGAVVEEKQCVTILKVDGQEINKGLRLKDRPLILPSSPLTMMGFKNSSVTSFS